MSVVKTVSTLSVLLFSLQVSLLQAAFTRQDPGEFKAVPPFLAAESGKPNVVIAMDISGSMKAVAYRDTGAGNWRTGLHDDFDPTKRYFGYFNSEKKYTYDTGQGYFTASGDLTGAGNIQGTLGATEWNGNFLNWVSMRRIDVIRKVLVGGKLESRASGLSKYVLVGQNEPYDYSFKKAYSNSDEFTPSAIPDNTQFEVKDGLIQPTSSTGLSATQISNELEVGRVTMDWDESEQNWRSVTYLNTYTDPIVVALSPTYNGGDPVLARVRNVTTTGFDVRLQEHDYKDGNHTTEDITYIVAEKGVNTFSVNLSGGGTQTVRMQAGDVSTTAGAAVSLSGYSSAPVLFTGISSSNGATPAIGARVTALSSSSFSAILEPEEGGSGTNPTAEEIHYVALEAIPVGSTSTGGAKIQVGTKTNVTHAWSNVDLSGNNFASTPFFGATMQTYAGSDPANVRIGNAQYSASTIDVQVDEDQANDSEVNHVAETLGFIAVTAANGFQIRVAEDTMPTGIIQDNANTMRFGLAVYNYDHVNKTPTNLYNGNSAHGGTFYPCYPDVTKATSDRTTTDICLRTDIREANALQNIVQVIEQHPLIWGTTPIAETLYDIWGYFGQNQVVSTAEGRPGNTPFYDTSGSTSNGSYPAYTTSTAWDPYYYPEYGGTLRCAKSYVLHFNDGAPYTDWNGNSSNHPSIVNGDSVGAIAENEALDDIAWLMRKNDCRADLDGHQEIISYYVYAALGEGEQNNTSTQRMMEAAANGGFYDVGYIPDGSTAKTGVADNLPSPAHPANFQTYFAQTPPCEINEWDRNGDCNPDTFYNADDAESLITELEAAFASILQRTASGGASSVVSSSITGIGAIYSGLFRQNLVDSDQEVKWTGNVYSLFVDSAGRLRADKNSNRVLDDYVTDPIVDMCTDAGEKKVRVKLSTADSISTAAGDRPTAAQKAVCSATLFTDSLDDLDFIWDAHSWLAGADNTGLAEQRSYTATDKKRYIFTGMDPNNQGGPVGTSDTIPLVYDSLDATQRANLNALMGADNTTTDLEKLINFVRGQEQTGDANYRSRTAGTTTYRLGDVIYSTPTLVSRPAEAYDLLYGDSSYLDFRRKWANRRHVVYVGSNDGMLHAFNAGWYNAAEQKFYKGPPSGTGSLASGDDGSYDLGAELWAYVPQAALPYLKYMSGAQYGDVPGDHVYTVDLTPRVFDAKVFNADTTHTNGWGTILVVGMRMGGGKFTFGEDAVSGDDYSTYSSYSIFDITDPESPPVLMMEYSAPTLGYTLSRPAPVRMNDKWYLMLTSGPSTGTNDSEGFKDVNSIRRGEIHLIDLDYTDSALSLATDFGTNGIMPLADVSSPSIDNSKSFISEPLVVDFNLDAKADAIYFGSVTGDATSGWGGDLYRIRIQDNQDGTTYKALTNWDISLLSQLSRPVTAKPGASVDPQGNRWVYVGSGRFFTPDDVTDVQQQSFYGVKEPRTVPLGNWTWGTVSGLLDVSSAAVSNSSGVLSGVSTPGLNTGDTPQTLENLMMQHATNSGTAPYLNGWKKDLDAGNKVLGASALLGGTLTYTSYKPNPIACEFEGQSYLYALNYITGTAGTQAILGTDTSGNNETALLIGTSPALTPSLHRGSGYTNDAGATANVSGAILTDSGGETQTIDLNNQSPVSSGEVGWRKIFTE